MVGTQHCYHNYCPCNNVYDPEYDADGSLSSRVPQTFGLVALHNGNYTENQPGNKETDDSTYKRHVSGAVGLPFVVCVLKGALPAVIFLLPKVVLLTGERRLAREGRLTGIGLPILVGRLILVRPLILVRLLILVGLRFFDGRLVLRIACAAVAAKLSVIRISRSAWTNH